MASDRPYQARFTVRLTCVEIEHLRSLARAMERTPSSALRLIIRQALENAEENDESEG